MSNNLPSIIESLLFVSSKPLTVKDFCKLLEKSPEEVKPALETLVATRKDCGVVILDNNGEYQMATNAENSTVVKNFLNAELREKLTDASVEVLGIIAYRQPISKAEIEAIRGVNSQYSLRHLLMRGLIEKTPSLNDARSFVYQTTTEFLSHLGLNSIQDLPEFEKLVEQIKLPENQILNSEKITDPTPIVETTNPTPTPQLPSNPIQTLKEPNVKAEDKFEIEETDNDAEDEDEDEDNDEDEDDDEAK
jgi:segregation and condensation protein B